MWGFSASPLVVGELVVTYTGAEDDKSVIAYRRTDGEIAWTAGNSTHSYSSPQRVHTRRNCTNLGLQRRRHGCVRSRREGKQLWKHEWDIGGMSRIVQPLVLGDDVLLGTGYGFGTQRVTVTNNRRPVEH